MRGVAALMLHKAFDVRRSTFDVLTHASTRMCWLTRTVVAPDAGNLACATSHVERRTSNVLLMLAMAVLLLSGCYRMKGPEDLGQAVRVEITSNDARLVRCQGYLQQEVADALVNRLGWTVSPQGSAKLQITIEREDINASGTDQRNTPSRWTVVLGGQVLLNSRRRTAAFMWTGSGYTSALSSTLDDEASALKNAAASAALSITTWLEAELRPQPGTASAPR